MNDFLFYYAISFLFFVNTTIVVLQWVTVWQIKEYRIDRMRDFFSTISGKRALLDTLIIVCVMIYSFFTDLTPTRLLFLLALCLLFFVRKRTRPQWTMKAILLCASVLGIVCFTGMLFLFFFDALIVIPLLTALTPLCVALVVLLLHPITMWQKARIIAQAKEKIDTLQTSVIGITGSFGKTTTKEFLHAMLSQRYSVLSTPKNINVDIGVAHVVNDQLREEHDFFIVEMGAYRVGEIQAICDMTSPIIGIITALNAQHLSLFGSLQAIQLAKGELLRSLPSTGLSVINKDFPACVEMAEQSTAQVKFFSADQFAHAYASDVIVAPDAISCVIHIGEESSPVTIPLFGKQVIPSILAAATVARHVGCTMEEITTAITQLEPIAGTMHVKPGKRDSVIIDDHYNANPDGFLAALDYQDVFIEQRKIVITPGMYELAELSRDKHHTIGSRIAEVADVLIVTKDDFAAPLHAGATQGMMPEENIHILASPKKVIAWLEQNLQPNDVVLLEGRVHAQIVNYLEYN